MAEKATLSFRISTTLAESFKDSMEHYRGKLGLCFAAALLQFLESDPTLQRDFIKRVFDAELEDDLKAAIDAALDSQKRKVAERHGRPAKQNSIRRKD